MCESEYFQGHAPPENFRLLQITCQTKRRHLILMNTWCNKVCNTILKEHVMRPIGKSISFIKSAFYQLHEVSVSHKFAVIGETLQEKKVYVHMYMHMAVQSQVIILAMTRC